MANPVVYFEILAKDGKAAQEFYASLFDWKIDANSPMGYGMVETAPGGIAGGIGPTDLFVGHVTFYVEVDDLDAYLTKAESLGGRVMLPPTEVGDTTKYALLADPEGHLVGLVKSERR